jgi:hypothetical protein
VEEVPGGAGQSIPARVAGWGRTIGGNGQVSTARYGRGAAMALFAALVLAASARATTSDSPELSRLATAFRGGIPIAVRCATSQANWGDTLARRRIPPYVVGFAYIGDPRVWLSPSICVGVPRADPWAVLVLLHELIHTSGVRSERAANCMALRGERAFLVAQLGVSTEHAQTVYAQSRARAMAEPAAYRPVGC